MGLAAVANTTILAMVQMDEDRFGKKVREKRTDSGKNIQPRFGKNVPPRFGKKKLPADSGKNRQIRENLTRFGKKETIREKTK